MYCSNCGNKVDEKAYICVNCGVILKKEEDKKVKKIKKDGNITGIVSIIFGVLGFLISICLFFFDISDVGMYTETSERIFYALGYVFIPFVLSGISLLFALLKTHKISNKIGLTLSLIALFLILTEFVIIIIY